MRKVTALLFSFLLLLTFGTSTLASEKEDVEKALELIEKSNAKIDQEIEKAVAKADQLQGEYFNDIQSVKGSEAIIALRNEQSDLEAQLLNSTDQASLDSIKAKLSALDSEVANLEKTLSSQSDYFASRTAEFHSDLDSLINDLDLLTRQMTADAIKKAAELGVKAECVWKLVKIAHRWVWIDPIEVIGT